MDMNAKKKKAVELLGAPRGAPAARPISDNDADDVPMPASSSAPSISSRYAHVIEKRKGGKK